mgnify:CR=1 FL=1
MVEKLAKTARDHSISMASHDDKTAATRQFYNSLVCYISEFPLTAEAINQAQELGNHIVLGAPNIIRGGSHMGESGLSAAESIKAGKGDIICSDYYYPALMQAPFKLVADKILVASMVSAIIVLFDESYKTTLKSEKLTGIFHGL